jgi:hypothetical protein
VAVSHQHLRESQALHLDYYKRKEKKMFHIKETCVAHPRARPRATNHLARQHQFASVDESGGVTQGESKKLRKRLSNGRFSGAQILTHGACVAS